MVREGTTMLKRNLRWSRWLRLRPLVFAMLALPACEEDDDLDISLRPGWVQNQEFHLETSYNRVGMKHNDGDLAANPEVLDATEDTGALDDSWSEPVYWRYQVVKQGWLPDSQEDLAEYSVKGGTTSALTVIKASLDTSMNIGNELLETDPKVYLVIREDRLRLAGMVSYYTIGDERQSEALSVGDDEMNRSYSRLSQTSLSVVPHFIPPFPIRAEDADLELEDGQRVAFRNADADSVDVVYENSMDASEISETWAEGQPWATLSVTPTVHSRLLTSDEVEELQGPLGAVMDEGDDPDDLTYVEALKAPLGLDASLKIVADMIGTTTGEASVGKKPWAGSWWPQGKGALVMGHINPELSVIDTISKIKANAFKAFAGTMQTKGDELRSLRQQHRESSPEYTAAVNAYRAAQNSMTTEMQTFYGAIRSGIDAGRITISNGRISAAANWNQNTASPYPAFDFPLNNLSPFDKFALLQQKEGHTYSTNPWLINAWEMLNHWSPNGSSWWGHCNGWSAAAILANEPRAAKAVTFGNNDQFTMNLSVADQKGLLSETHYSTLSNFYGSRFNGDEGDDLSDLSPKAVIQILRTYIGERHVPLVFDTTASEEVWNFPAWRYTLTLNETTTGGAQAATGIVNINTAGRAELMTLDLINEVRADRIIAYRQQRGPFQTTQSITNVRGIGMGIFNRIKEKITVSASSTPRTFSGSIAVQFATDGVDYAHVDSNPESPQGFQETWEFTLQASPSGEIISGTWAQNDKHPDFAWVPYANTVSTGSSENNYLQWLNLKEYLGDSIVRQ